MRHVKTFLGNAGGKDYSAVFHRVRYRKYGEPGAVRVMLPLQGLWENSVNVKRWAAEGMKTGNSFSVM